MIVEFVLKISGFSRIPFHVQFMVNVYIDVEQAMVSL